MDSSDRCCHGYSGGFAFLGRLFISIIFILAGLSKIFLFQEAVDALRSAGIEQGTHFFIIAALTLEIVGGLMILFGCCTRVGCGILMVFLIPTTLIFHAFWKFQGSEHALQLANFLKNLAIFGGLILLAVYGPGRWSLDARSCKTCRTRKSDRV